MFINYIPWMLVNIGAGLFLLGYYVDAGLECDRQKRWIAGFGMTGALAWIGSILKSLLCFGYDPVNLRFAVSKTATSVVN